LFLEGAALLKHHGSKKYLKRSNVSEAMASPVLFGLSAEGVLMPHRPNDAFQRFMGDHPMPYHFRRVHSHVEHG